MKVSSLETRVSSHKMRFLSREKVVTYFWAVLYFNSSVDNDVGYIETLNIITPYISY